MHEDDFVYLLSSFVESHSSEVSMFRAISLCLALTLAAPSALAAEPVDHDVIARMKLEGFQRSRAMEALSYLTDVHGPRLTGSPAYRAAAEWARGRLAEYGLANARLDPWGTFGKGWSLTKVSVELAEPQYAPLIAYPKAWTRGTNGPVSGQPILVDVTSKDDFAKYRGKLRGAIVMNGAAPVPRPLASLGTRLDEKELAEMARAIDPGEPRTYRAEDEFWKKFVATSEEITKFFIDEGVSVLVEPSARDWGIVRVATQSYTNFDVPFTAIVLAREHYGRVARLLEKKVPVRLDVDVRVAVHDQDTTGYNVIAEIPGTDPKLKDEVVMLGAHLDSWHAGTGATDNAAGCVVMMEAVRILKAIGARPRRTVRIALWGGEEQGYFGSLGYVRKHFGDPDKVTTLPGHAKLAAYFNLDNGTGRIRGVYLQGNELVRPIFESWLAPFNYLGASTLTVKNTSGTDHMPFEALGLPGFQFIQDPVEYGTRTHHTSMDVYEAVSEEDLQVSSVIVASFAYNAAMREEMLPREPAPRPEAK